MTDENKTQHDLLSIDCMIPNPGNSDAVFSITAKGLNRLALISPIFNKLLEAIPPVLDEIRGYYEHEFSCHDSEEVNNLENVLNEITKIKEENK